MREQVLPPDWVWSSGMMPVWALELAGEQQYARWCCQLAMLCGMKGVESESHTCSSTTARDGLRVDLRADIRALRCCWAATRALSSGIGTGDGHDGEENGLGVEEHLD